jgi:hypothetical protein
LAGEGLSRHAVLRLYAGDRAFQLRRIGVARDDDGGAQGRQRRRSLAVEAGRPFWPGRHGQAAWQVSLVDVGNVHQQFVGVGRQQAGQAVEGAADRQRAAVQWAAFGVHHAHAVHGAVRQRGGQGEVEAMGAVDMAAHRWKDDIGGRLRHHVVVDKGAHCQRPVRVGRIERPAVQAQAAVADHGVDGGRWRQGRLTQAHLAGQRRAGVGDARRNNAGRVCRQRAKVGHEAVADVGGAERRQGFGQVGPGDIRNDAGNGFVIKAHFNHDAAIGPFCIDGPPIHQFVVKSIYCAMPSHRDCGSAIRYYRFGVHYEKGKSGSLGTWVAGHPVVQPRGSIEAVVEKDGAYP